MRSNRKRQRDNKCQFSSKSGDQPGLCGKSIRIFGFEITFFGLLIAAGMLLGLGFIVLEARRCGEKEDDYLEMMILSLVTGVIGARALYVCFSWNLYKGNVNQIFNLRGGGLAFTAGCSAACWRSIYCASAKRPSCRWQILPVWDW